MKKFWIKTVNIILIIGIIFGYNQIVLYREKTEEVNSLQAKLKDASTMVKNVEYIANAEQSLDNSTEENSDNNGYKDGTYTGQAKGFGGQVIVDVAIAGSKIDSINIVSADKEDKAYFDMAKGVIEEMMENQSADVDAISGATFSSNGIINAVKQALEKAESR